MHTFIQSASSNQWFTEKEVSKITSLSVSTLQKQRFHCRGIPYFKIGRAVRYSEADVIQFMEAMRINILAC